MTDDEMFMELAEADAAHQVALNVAICDVVRLDPKGFGSAQWRATSWAWSESEEVAETFVRLRLARARIARRIDEGAP